MEELCRSTRELFCCAGFRRLESNKEELCRSTRDIPPSHFLFKVDFFSALSSSNIKQYESKEFSAGDYKWKLRLYPNGNNTANGEDHISLYLVAANKIDLNKEIVVSFSLFAFDHVRNTYLSVQAPVTRFTAIKSESGFSKFLTLDHFKDPSRGYLNNDSCMFGVEVFTIQNKAAGQCLTMRSPRFKNLPYKFTWNIENFSGYEDKEHSSKIFLYANHSWSLSFYPKGDTNANSMSLYLHLESSNLGAGNAILTKFTLRVVDQVNNNHRESTGTVCFHSSSMSWGIPQFLPLSNLNKGTGYLVKDTCVVEAEVTVLGTSKNWM